MLPRISAAPIRIIRAFAPAKGLISRKSASRMLTMPSASIQQRAPAKLLPSCFHIRIPPDRPQSRVSFVFPAALGRRPAQHTLAMTPMIPQMISTTEDSPCPSWTRTMRQRWNKSTRRIIKRIWRCGPDTPGCAPQSGIWYSIIWGGCLPAAAQPVARVFNRTEDASRTV